MLLSSTVNLMACVFCDSARFRRVDAKGGSVGPVRFENIPGLLFPSCCISHIIADSPMLSVAKSSKCDGCESLDGSEVSSSHM